MNKKTYQIPATQVVNINVCQQILAGSGKAPVNAVGSNLPSEDAFTLGGGSNSAPSAAAADPRSRSFDDWGD